MSPSWLRSYVPSCLGASSALSCNRLRPAACPTPHSFLPPHACHERSHAHGHPQVTDAPRERDDHARGPPRLHECTHSYDRSLWSLVFIPGIACSSTRAGVGRRARADHAGAGRARSALTHSDHSFIVACRHHLYSNAPAHTRRCRTHRRAGSSCGGSPRSRLRSRRGATQVRSLIDALID
jgi:hypothetical protein